MAGSDMQHYQSPHSHAELMHRARRVKHVVLDMDGTIYMGMTLFPFTIPFLQGLKGQGIGYSFLTNNPSKDISDFLRKLGFVPIKRGSFAELFAEFGNPGPKLPSSV